MCNSISEPALRCVFLIAGAPGRRTIVGVKLTALGRNMAGRRLVTSAGVITLSWAAYAAEPAPPPPPPPPAWTGFYLGLNAGGTWSSNDTIGVRSLLAFANPAADPSIATGIAGANGATRTFSVNSGGFIGGGQIGYNYQFSNGFVAGIEADIQGISGSSKTNALFTSELILFPPLGNFADTSLNVSNGLHYLGIVRGRLGFPITSALLIFEDAGLAYGGVRASTSITQFLTGPSVDTINAPYFASGGAAAARVGWTAGGGVEWLFLPNWSLRTEYLYYSLGSLTYSNGLLVNVVTPPGGIVPAGGIWNSIVSQSHARFQGNTVRAAINFHFN
jgi:outer membrane immunogenic protein